MNLFRTFSAYTLLGFLNAGLGFLLLPVLTTYLSPSDYGIISLVNVYVSVLMPVLGLSTAGLATIEYYNTGTTKACCSCEVEPCVFRHSAAGGGGL